MNYTLLLDNDPLHTFDKTRSNEIISLQAFIRFKLLICVEAGLQKKHTTKGHTGFKQKQAFRVQLCLGDEPWIDPDTTNVFYLTFVNMSVQVKAEFTCFNFSSSSCALFGTDNGEHGSPIRSVFSLPQKGHTYIHNFFYLTMQVI